jgi:hypothetical protein
MVIVARLGEGLPGVITAAAPYAGLTGIAMGAVIWFFQESIFKNIFPQLTRQHAFEKTRLIIFCSFGLGVLGIAAWAFGSISTSKPAALIDSMKPLGGKKGGPANNASGSASLNANQPWEGAADWMGGWAGDWNNTTVQQAYGNGNCSFSKVETFTLNIAAKSQNKLSGTFATDLNYGYELTLTGGGGNATKFVVRVCPAPGANYDTSPPSHVVRHYTIDVVKSEMAPAKRLMKLVLVDCRLDDRRCPNSWWVGTRDATLKLYSAQRMDYVATDEKPELRIAFSRPK